MKAMLALLLALFLVVCMAAQASTFGRFIEISCERFDDTAQYLVYDRSTLVVYVYTVYKDSVNIAPYIMRNVFGEMTVGIYNVDGGYIEPMEPYCDEYGEVWIDVG